MTFQLHPLAFGVMLVVAVGTFAYTFWNSRQQREEYHHQGNGRRSRDYYRDFEPDFSSTRSSSTLDDDERPSKKKRNGERCAICLGSMKDSLKTLTCAHIFHERCITAWLINSNTCPICRKVSS